MQLTACTDKQIKLERLWAFHYDWCVMTQIIKYSSVVLKKLSASDIAFVNRTHKLQWFDDAKII